MREARGGGRRPPPAAVNPASVWGLEETSEPGVVAAEASETWPDDDGFRSTVSSHADESPEWRSNSGSDRVEQVDDRASWESQNQSARGAAALASTDSDTLSDCSTYSATGISDAPRLEQIVEEDLTGTLSGTMRLGRNPHDPRGGHCSATCADSVRRAGSDALARTLQAAASAESLGASPYRDTTLSASSDLQKAISGAASVEVVQIAPARTSSASTRSSASTVRCSAPKSPDAAASRSPRPQLPAASDCSEDLKAACSGVADSLLEPSAADCALAGRQTRSTASSVASLCRTPQQTAAIASSDGSRTSMGDWDAASDAAEMPDEWCEATSSPAAAVRRTRSDLDGLASGALAAALAYLPLLCIADTQLTALAL